MLAAGAAAGNRQVTPVDRFVLWNPFLQEHENIVEHLAERRLCIEELDDFVVTAGQAPQLQRPVRIRQAAQIEDEVGIGRYAVLEAE